MGYSTPPVSWAAAPGGKHMSAAEKQRRQYLATQITTASKEQLVAMLFDGIVRFCGAARDAYNETPIQYEAGGSKRRKRQHVEEQTSPTQQRDEGKK